MQPLLVWNASPSSPRGLYFVLPAKRVSSGDTVVAWPPPAAARLAARRGYLPPGVPLVKTAVAVSGDRICATEDRITINASRSFPRLGTDTAGRPMPKWHGCRTLVRSEVLLLGLSHAASFDGRYFGPSSKAHIVGRGRVLWRA